MSKEKYDALMIQKFKEVKQLSEKKRINLLDAYGLYTKITSTEKSEEYPFAEYEGEKVTYYKKVYESISDDEQQHLIDLDDQINGRTFDRNTLRLKKGNITLSFILGILMTIAGLFMAMFLMDDGLVGYALLTLVSALTLASILFSLSQLAAQLNTIITILIDKEKNKSS